MALLIDPPLWPAHGTLWSHLISDTSLDELHAFARRLQLPRRSFDLDHYDVPAEKYDLAVDLGATPVSARDLVSRLRDSGLRVRKVDREGAKVVARRRFLTEHWLDLARSLELAGGLVPGCGEVSGQRWMDIGQDLLHRWNEPHRGYHDERHLEDVLLSLDHMASRGEPLDPVSVVAAWFHDAVYAGVAGQDEQDSADLAAEALRLTQLTEEFAQQVHELILATAPGAKLQGTARELMHPIAMLLDADLSILGSSEHRYAEYTRGVRREYAHVAEADFRRGRAQILRRYLELDRIYRTDAGHYLWERQARKNLSQEIASLTGS